ncbi:MAG TPA: glycosyltransferase [Acidimicrobiales bacterium]|nr:glycosyltransferase [Acidimicrobiales bacterium]
MIDLSVVIPAFNEGDRLAAGYERLAPLLETLDPSTLEVVIVDDGSTDNTMQRAHEVYGHLEHTRYVQQPANFGKGAALRLGLSLANGAHVITADADMAIDPMQFPLFVIALRESDFVPGSRAVAGHINYDSHLRTASGEVFNAVVRHYTHLRVRDTQCGCKALRRGPARLLASLAMVDGFAFDVELFYLADQLNLNVKPLLVTWEDVTGSSVHPGKVARTMFRDIRDIPKTRYENLAIELAADVEIDAITPLARDARLPGLVLARGERDALLVVGRDGGLGGLSVAAALGGSLRPTTLSELRGRSYEAI